MLDESEINNMRKGRVKKAIHLLKRADLLMRLLT